MFVLHKVFCVTILMVPLAFPREIHLVQNDHTQLCVGRWDCVVQVPLSKRKSLIAILVLVSGNINKACFCDLMVYFSCITMHMLFSCDYTSYSYLIVIYITSCNTMCTSTSSHMHACVGLFVLFT